MTLLSIIYIHKIIPFKCTNQWFLVNLLSFTPAAKNQFWNIIIIPVRSFRSIFSYSLFPVSVPGNHSYFGVYLPFLDISYAWNHVMCDLLCLALSIPSSYCLKKNEMLFWPFLKGPGLKFSQWELQGGLPWTHGTLFSGLFMILEP